MFSLRQLSRRDFMHTATTAGTIGLAAPYFVPASALGRADKPAASERLRIGLIGAGGMGRGNLSNCAKHPDVVVTGVCDVWKERRDAVVAKHAGTCKPYHDYREMLGRKDIDAVIIATPPHWHCLQAIDACEAGKDIYLQKPMTLHVAEGLALKRAVEKHKRISQIGTQIHAGENYRRVVELVRSNNLGKISIVRTFNVMNQGPEGIGNPPNSDPPAGIDWNFWVGPGPMRPFNRLAVQSAYTHCSFMDYSGGWTPGMAPHIIDLPYWAFELDFPLVTSCSGGRYTIRDAGDVPDTQEILWQYPEMTMALSMSMVNSYGFDFGHGKPARRLGIYFHGVNGTMYANYGMHQIVPEGDRMKDAQTPEKSLPPSPGHEREWLDCIRSRKQPSCNVSYHYKVDAALTLGNLALKLGRSIRFDPKTEQIVGDAEAAKLAVPEYRAPWKFPTQYLQA